MLWEMQIIVVGGGAGGVELAMAMHHSLSKSEERPHGAEVRSVASFLSIYIPLQTSTLRHPTLLQ